MLTKAKRRFWYAAFAGIFSFSNCYVYMLEKEIAWDAWDTAILVFNVLFLAAAVFVLMDKFFLRASEFAGNLLRREKGTSLSDRQYFFLTTAVIFLLWLPVFLAYYPGLFAYDVMYQIPQVLRSYNTHHPLTHTLFLQFFYYIIGERVFGSYNAGVAAASIVQMLLFSMMLSFSHLYLRRIGLDKRWRAFLIFATGVFPVFPMLAISTTKDTLFAGFFVVLFTLLCYYQTEPETYVRRKDYAFLYILIVVCNILFRNNGIYPVLILLPVLLLKALKEKFNGRILCYTAIGLAIGLMASSGLKVRLQAYEGSKNEMLSLPYQQLACAYSDHKEEMTEGEIAVIHALLPDVEDYTPHSADPVKTSSRGAEDLPSLLSIYITIGSKFPDSYIKGFFQLNAGYLGLTDVSYGRIYGTDNRQGIFLSDTKEGFGITHHSLFPGLESLYEKLYTSNAYEYVPVLRLINSPALYLWLIGLAALYAIVHKIGRALPMFTFLSVFVLTNLAAPCVLPRYALPYIVCVPTAFFCAVRLENQALAAELPEKREEYQEGLLSETALGGS